MNRATSANTASTTDATTDATTASTPAVPTAVPGGAFAAIAGAVVLAACNVCSGLYPTSGSTRDLISWFGMNAGLAELVSALGLLATILLVPGIWTVTHRLRTRTPVLAAVGGWLMATGYLVSTVLSFETLSTVSLLRAGADPAVLADAADNQTPVTLTAVYFLFGLGALIGTLVLGIAMVRQRGVVPAWAGWAMVLSAPVRIIGLVTGLTLVGPPVASLLIAVGFAGLFLARSRAAR